MAQTRLGNIRKCKFQLWAFSAEAPGNGNTVVHFVMDRPFVTRVIYLRPTWTHQGAFDCGEAGKQPATDGLSLSAPLLWCESGLVWLPFFIWDRESRDKIHRLSPPKPILAINFRVFFTFSSLCLPELLYKANLTALIFTSAPLGWGWVDVREMAKRWEGRAAFNIL